MAKKTKAALDAGLAVILCIGETLQQREANKTTDVVDEQLSEVVKVLAETDWRCVASVCSCGLC